MSKFTVVKHLITWVDPVHGFLTTNEWGNFVKHVRLNYKFDNISELRDIIHCVLKEDYAACVEGSDDKELYLKFDNEQLETLFKLKFS